MAHLAVLVVAIVVFVVYKVLGNRKIVDKEKSPTVYEFPKKTRRKCTWHRGWRQQRGGRGREDNHHEIKNPISSNQIIWLNLVVNTLCNTHTLTHRHATLHEWSQKIRSETSVAALAFSAEKWLSTNAKKKKQNYGNGIGKNDWHQR